MTGTDGIGLEIEGSLEGHDIAISHNLPSPSSERGGLAGRKGIIIPPSQDPTQRRTFRFLLLCAGDHLPVISSFGHSIELGTIDIAAKDAQSSSATEARLRKKISRLLSLTGGVGVGIILLLDDVASVKASSSTGMNSQGGDGGGGLGLGTIDAGGLRRGSRDVDNAESIDDATAFAHTYQEKTMGAGTHLWMVLQMMYVPVFFLLHS